MNKNVILILSLLGLLSFWTACDKAPDPTNNNNNQTCENTFASLGTMTDSRDGNIYATVTIGGQTWMAENLRFNMANSYLDPLNPCEKYGRLYDWATVMNGSSSSSANPSGVQGICPSGWHLPSDAEWNTLEISLGMSAGDANIMGFRGTHAPALKSTVNWNSSGNGTNSSGFNVYPVGYGGASAMFYGMGSETYFLTSTEFSSTNAWSRSLDYNRDAVLRDYDISKGAGMSCRCVED